MELRVVEHIQCRDKISEPPISLLAWCVCFLHLAQRMHRHISADIAISEYVIDAVMATVQVTIDLRFYLHASFPCHKGRVLVISKHQHFLRCC